MQLQVKLLWPLVTIMQRYGDSVDNTAQENSSFFSLVGMHWLPSARACGHQQNPPVLNWRCRLMQVNLYYGCKTGGFLLLCTGNGENYQPTRWQDPLDECQAAMSDGRTRQGCGTGTSQLQQLLQVDSEIARYSRHEGKDFASIQASQEQSVRHKFEKYTSMEACDTRQTAIKLHQQSFAINPLSPSPFWWPFSG